MARPSLDTMRTSLWVQSFEQLDVGCSPCVEAHAQLACHEQSAVFRIAASAILRHDHGRAELRQDRPADARTDPAL
jgi:hypothetical protein